MGGEFFWFLLACWGICWMFWDIERQREKGFSYRNKYGMKIDFKRGSVGYDMDDEQTRKAFWDHVKATIESPEHQEIARKIRENGSYRLGD